MSVRLSSLTVGLESLTDSECRPNYENLAHDLQTVRFRFTLIHTAGPTLP